MTDKRHSYTCFAHGSTFGAFAAIFWLICGAPVVLAQDSQIDESLDGGWFGGSQAYDLCITAVEMDPDDGFERSLSWQAQGGGPPAEHCGILALVALELFAEAASRLDAMAQSNSNGLGADIRAQLLVQASSAWMLEGFPQQALESLRAAEALEPASTRINLDIHFDRARAHSMDANWALAIESLDQALLIAPFAQDALVLRATGNRALGQINEALADLTRVLNDDPEYAPAYLERGVLKRLEGETDGARADWIRVLMIEPEGELADAARAHLHDLDFPDGLTE